MDFRDERTQREFLQTLRDQGIPISSRRLAVGISWDPDREREAVIEEEATKAVTEAEVKKRTLEKAREEGLLPYLDADMIQRAADDAGTNEDSEPASETGTGQNGGPPHPQRPEQSDNQKKDAPKAYKIEDKTASNRFGSTPIDTTPKDEDDNSSEQSEVNSEWVELQMDISEEES